MEGLTPFWKYTDQWIRKLLGEKYNFSDPEFDELSTEHKNLAKAIAGWFANINKNGTR